jgi:hypothetical protein
MTNPIHVDVTQYSVRARWLMIIAWLLIGAKCMAVTWAVDRWHMPFHAAWVVVPTLVFAALATGLWLTHHRE